MNDEHVDLENLAALISDGKPIDWSQAHATNSSSDEAQTVDNLESLDAIIRSHHSLQAGPDGLCNWGPLRIIRHIASGSFGDVYRAYDASLDRDVALKLLRPELASSPDKCLRLLQEGRSLARVQHENVAIIYGAEQHDERIGIWMELIEGESLADILATQGTMSAEETAVAGVVICRALSAVHAAGQAHGDIKAQNILREVGGRLVLTDFGSGSCLSDTKSLVSGTPLYLAPEVLAGGPTSVASDVYSLGILLFHLVSGHFPHQTATLAELKESHRNKLARSLRDACPGLAPELISVIERATATAAGDRFHSVGEFEKALQNYLGADHLSYGSGAISKRLRFWGSVSLVILAGLALGTTLYFWRAAVPEYTVDATMHRSNEAGSLPVASGATVAPGDRLFLELEASTNLYAYVLNQDEQGDTFILFPLPGQSLTNPLSGGRRHRLPGPLNGQPYSWQVTSAGGIEHFLIITSPDALPELETMIARLNAATTGTTARKADPADLSVFRGVGGLVSDQSPATSTSGDLFQQVDQLLHADGDQRAQGIWIKRIDLLNPVQ